MKSRLITILSVLSLALCIAACGLWVRSWMANDMVRWTNGDRDRYVAVSANRGEFEIVYGAHVPEAVARYRSVDSPAPGFEFISGSSYANEPNWRPQFREDDVHVAGFAYRARSIWIVYERTWAVPLWSVAVFTAAISARWLRRRFIAQREKRKSHCRGCGYDLRATPNRCPECGMVPAH